DFKTLYTSKKAYQVRILYNQSKSIGAGKTVTFYFYKNGKIKATKTSKTDSRGYAKVNFNVVAGEYKVKTKYGPTAVTKKYIVKPIITINKIGKGNSRGMPKPVTAKKFVFGATLKKVDGKYLKGKKVKITFYRWDDNDNRIKVKTLTKKINSKGVVKVTYKKFPFKIKYGGWYDGWFAVVFSYLKEKGEATLYVKSASPIKYAYC
ncbi:MAG: hypothetical protein UIB63_09485, partial [Methanobrevibacter sp.]